MSPDIDGFYKAAIEDLSERLGVDAEKSETLREQLNDAFQQKDYATISRLASELDSLPQNPTSELLELSNEFNQILERHNLAGIDIEFPFKSTIPESGQKPGYIVANFSKVIISSLLERDPDTGDYIFSDWNSLTISGLKPEHNRNKRVIREVRVQRTYSTVGNFYRMLLKYANGDKNTKVAQAIKGSLAKDTQGDMFYTSIHDQFGELSLLEFGDILYRFSGGKKGK